MPFPIDIYNRSRLKDIFNKSILFRKKSDIPWTFSSLADIIKSKIDPSIYGWYEETSSSAGTSSLTNVQAFLKYKACGSYLQSSKEFDCSIQVNLYSKDLGKTTFYFQYPFFICPYGVASMYGNKSDDFNNCLAAKKTNIIYTIPSFSIYPLEQLYEPLKPGVAMFQLYLTSVPEINESIIRRARKAGISIIILTIDAGFTHGSTMMTDLRSDLTFSSSIAGNLFNDPVFNLFCFNTTGCVATKDPKILKLIKQDVVRCYNVKKSFDYARQIQFEGMSRQNAIMDPTSPLYPWSIHHIATICHTYRLPLVVKGIMTKEDAILCHKCGADGVYVSNHGGRFVTNSVAPIDIVREISIECKKLHHHFGVWYDSGIRTGSDILTAFRLGAEFVGIGRPIIYANVANGKKGVEQMIEQLLHELKTQARVIGLNRMSNLV